MMAAASAGGNAPQNSGPADDVAVLKLLETLQTDLRTLCLQTKKRFPHIREVNLLVFKIIDYL